MTTRLAPTSERQRERERLEALEQRCKNRARGLRAHAAKLIQQAEEAERSAREFTRQLEALKP